MKIEWVAEQSGRSGLRVAEVHRYDGHPPITEFWMDAAPLSLSQDRLAVASTLVWAPWVAGEFQFPKQVGAETATSIIAYCEPTWVVPAPIDYGPKPIPDGLGRIAIDLSCDLGTSPAAFAPGNGTEVRMTVLGSDSFAGSLSSLGRFVVASNAFLLSELSGHPGAAYLAAGVLFAEDLVANSIELPSRFCGSLRNRPKIDRLLASTGLRLNCPDQHEHVGSFDSIKEA